MKQRYPLRERLRSSGTDFRNRGRDGDQKRQGLHRRFRLISALGKGRKTSVYVYEGEGKKEKGGHGP